VAQSEDAKFWLQVLTELQNRGVGDRTIVLLLSPPKEASTAKH
jgi:transposase-like protein